MDLDDARRPRFDCRRAAGTGPPASRPADFVTITPTTSGCVSITGDGMLNTPRPSITEAGRGSPNNLAKVIQESSGAQRQLRPLSSGIEVPRAPCKKAEDKEGAVTRPGRRSCTSPAIIWKGRSLPVASCFLTKDHAAAPALNKAPGITVTYELFCAPAVRNCSAKRLHRLNLSVPQESTGCLSGGPPPRFLLTGSFLQSALKRVQENTVDTLAFASPPLVKSAGQEAAAGYPFVSPSHNRMWPRRTTCNPRCSSCGPTAIDGLAATLYHAWLTSTLRRVARATGRRQPREQPPSAESSPCSLESTSNSGLSM